ncbi:MAG: hypothetical protein ACRDZX_10140 [Acidimicrobiales bacterium]
MKEPSAPGWAPIVCALALVAGAAVASAGAVPAAASPPPTSACTGTVAGIEATAGTPQVVKVGTPFGTNLEATVVDGAGCPVAGAEVTFGALSSGPSASFAGAATVVTVTTGPNGVASAPTLTADQVSGSYTVTAEVASSPSYQVSFSITNTTAGVAATVSAASGGGQSAVVGSQFSSPLMAVVEDAYGAPVPGVTVDFSVVAAGGASASFASGGTSAQATTDAEGRATSPELVAGTTTGSFSVTTSVAGSGSTASFQLSDLASAPYGITAGAGSSQSAEAGTDFNVPLAVSVTDVQGNPVAGAMVRFSAPRSGPSGVFAGRGTTATVATDLEGVATAPPFGAGMARGGYVVTAKVAGLAQVASFALVNSPRTSASTSGPAGGYWLVTSAGRVLTSGGAGRYGPPRRPHLRGPAVAIVAAPDGHGYWLATASGAVYAYGDARYWGSTRSGSPHLNSPVVAMAATPDGKGYWLATRSGAVYAYGAARSYGSPAEAKARLAGPVVAMAATPDGEGYWLATRSGAVYAYGTARYYGPSRALHPRRPVTGMATTPDGKGYWLVSSDGAVFSFGDATFYGSGVGISPQPVKALVPTPVGGGYWLVSADGTVAGFGDAGAQGSPKSVKAAMVVAGAAVGRGT